MSVLAAAGVAGAVWMQQLRFDTQTIPGIAAAVVGVFLLLVGLGVIGRNAQSEELQRWLSRRRRRFRFLGGILVAFGAYLFLDAHGAFIHWL